MYKNNAHVCVGETDLDLHLLEDFTRASFTHAMHVEFVLVDSQIEAMLGPEGHGITSMMLQMELGITLVRVTREGNATIIIYGDVSVVSR